MAKADRPVRYITILRLGHNDVIQYRKGKYGG